MLTYIARSIGKQHKINAFWDLLHLKKLNKLIRCKSLINWLVLERAKRVWTTMNTTRWLSLCGGIAITGLYATQCNTMQCNAHFEMVMPPNATKQQTFRLQYMCVQPLLRAANKTDTRARWYFLKKKTSKGCLFWSNIAIHKPYEVVITKYCSRNFSQRTKIVQLFANLRYICSGPAGWVWCL